MAKRKVVVALGGNAILSTDASAKAQQEALMETAKYLVKFIEQGDELIISHGNGPQVGNLLIQQQAADSENTSNAFRYMCRNDRRVNRLLAPKRDG